MGSSGSGRFGTYQNISGNNGKTSEITCPSTIENINLEDIAISEYYTSHFSLPAVNSSIQLRDKIYLGRLVVETSDTNEIIGNLPTQYNYLISCIQKNINYSGNVISSGSSPIPFIVVTLNA